MKKLLFKQKTDQVHWVGDGFPVRSIFTYNDEAKHLSPFLLMDYAGPVRFPPSDSAHVRGVGEHPHRGFETVTIVYAGEVEHRDSAGGGGNIGPGDVQWMTAASGLVHEEKHGRDFAKRGGLFEMVQLWVNLPAAHKMAKPRYQGISAATVPVVNLPHGAGTVRIIAGEFSERKGPAHTYTPINLWDVRLQSGKAAELKVPEGHNTLVFVLKGRVKLTNEAIGEAAELAVFAREGVEILIEALGEDAKILILTGEPINEPVIGYGPFVMNTNAEIQQAFVDFESGRMGQIEQIEEI